MFVAGRGREVPCVLGSVALVVLLSGCCCDSLEDIFATSGHGDRERQQAQAEAHTRRKHTQDDALCCCCKAPGRGLEIRYPATKTSW